MNSFTNLEESLLREFGRIYVGYQLDNMGVVADSGLTDSALWLKLLVGEVHPTPTKQVVLAVDGPASHETLGAVGQFLGSKALNWSLSTANYTHKVQPLDNYFSGPHNYFFGPHNYFFGPHNYFFGPHNYFFGSDKYFSSDHTTTSSDHTTTSSGHTTTSSDHTTTSSEHACQAA